MIDKVDEAVNDNKLKRTLANRHIQLIAISGAVGTGLFMGSGKTINLAGPSIIFVYLIIGIVLFFVMRAMGEILLSNLKYKSFSDFSSDLLGPCVGFFTGWTYWFCWIITGIADVIAIAGYTQYWFPQIPAWVPMIMCIFVLLSLNLLTVKMFGEAEFWFSIIKIVAIIALIVVGFMLILSQHQATTGENTYVASISNIWNYGGIFANGIMGFFAGFQIAIFAFVGIELIGTTAAETKNPEKNLPRAINSVPVRIVFFYVFSLLIIMSVIPWIYITPTKSPFVELFALIGLPAAASVINFVVLTSAASSANSGIYSTSRMLFGLAKKKKAPTKFAKLSQRYVPANGLLFSCLCLFGGVILISLVPDILEAFTIVTTISALLFIFIWSIILVSYIAYRKKNKHLHQNSTFKLPGGIIICYVCLVFFIFVITLLLFKHDTRQALFATPIWFLILTIGYFCRKKKLSKLKSI